MFVERMRCEDYVQVNILKGIVLECLRILARDLPVEGEEGHKILQTM
jgi:hypothetical protein